MFDQLLKYKNKGSFQFKPTDNLTSVCNAPKDYSGLYVIYALENEKVNLIYIGISGLKGKDGKISHRKDGLRGRFLTGKTNGILRKTYWPQIMLKENIDALDIHWYVTYDGNVKDFPRDLEVELLKQYQSIYGCLPRWNSKT
jgi:hypothetical protein